MKLRDWPGDIPFRMIPELTDAEHGWWACEGGLFVDEPDGSLDDEGLWEAFERYADRLQAVSRALPWVLGDFFNLAETRWGESYAQLAEATGYHETTLYNAKWVCSRVPMEIRFHAPSFSHAQAVAPLPDVEMREAYLRMAEDNGWTRDDLRLAVRAILNEATPKWSEEGPDAHDGEIVPVAAIHNLPDVRRSLTAYRSQFERLIFALEDMVELELADDVRDLWGALNRLVGRVDAMLEAMDAVESGQAYPD